MKGNYINEFITKRSCTISSPGVPALNRRSQHNSEWNKMSGIKRTCFMMIFMSKLVWNYFNSCECEVLGYIQCDHIKMKNIWNILFRFHYTQYFDLIQRKLNCDLKCCNSSHSLSAFNYSQWKWFISFAIVSFHCVQRKCHTIINHIWNVRNVNNRLEKAST